jgi:hypothetical protein
MTGVHTFEFSFHERFCIQVSEELQAHVYPRPTEFEASADKARAAAPVASVSPLMLGLHSRKQLRPESESQVVWQSARPHGPSAMDVHDSFGISVSFCMLVHMFVPSGS